MKAIRCLALSALLVPVAVLPAQAETVSELVAGGYVVVNITVTPSGQWAWLYLGESADKPTYVCQIETPTHPNPSDTCRKLK